MSDDWPKSPFRAAMKPHVPVYQSVPLWRQQFAAVNMVSANLDYPPPDVIAAAALAHMASFNDHHSMIRALRDAVERYGVKGAPLKLKAPLFWPDLPWKRNLSLPKR